MTTFHALGREDWEDEPSDDQAEDLPSLGMSVRDTDDDAAAVDDEDAVVVAKVADDDEDEDSLSRLERLEKELNEPPVDIGDDEE